MRSITSMCAAGLIMLGGCAGDTGSSGETGDPDSVSRTAGGEESMSVAMPVLPGAYDPDAPSDAALLVGEFRVVDGCVRIGGGDRDNPDGTVVVWPPETTLAVDEDGTFEIRDYRGRKIAALGDTVGLGGGSLSSMEAMPEEVRKTVETGGCDGPYWVAGSLVPREAWDERYLPYLPVFPGEYDPEMPAHEALMTGIVHIVDGCVRVGRDYPGAPEGIVMIWPAESRLVRVGSAPPAFEIRDYRDSLLVRVGDTIRMGGSSTRHLPEGLRAEMEEHGCVATEYWGSGHPLPKKYW